MSSKRTLYLSILGIALLTILMLPANQKRKQINKALESVHDVFRKLDSLGVHGVPTNSNKSDASSSHKLPETNTLNSISKKILKTIIYYVNRDHMQVIPLPEFSLNVVRIENQEDVETTVKCMHGYIVELNKLKKLGDAYVIQSGVNKINFLQMTELKTYSFIYDCYDSLYHKIANVHVTAAENQMNVNISLNVNFRNHTCQIDKIDLNMLNIGVMFYLKINEIVGTKNFYENLLSWLNKYYHKKIAPVLRRVFLPRVTLSAYDTNVCSYFCSI